MKSMRSLAVAAALLFAIAGTPAFAGNLDTILTDYESVRAALARDDAAGLASLGRTIGAAAQRELETSKGEAAARLSSLRDAAAQLAASSGDLAASRKAFASLSKSVLDILAASPEMAKGKFVYACPMVKGYGKWVQAKKEIENPYYGTRMLRCAVPAKPEA